MAHEFYDREIQSVGIFLYELSLWNTYRLNTRVNNQMHDDVGQSFKLLMLN